MSFDCYWLLDVAAEPDRAELRSRRLADPAARDVRTSAITRYDYYAQIARAAAMTAFDGLFIAHRDGSDDSQIVAATIAREAHSLRLVPEFPASVGSAVYAAKQAASFQRLAHGRLAWAFARDGDAETRARGGDFVSEEELLVRTEEFLHVAQGVHSERPFSFAGQHFEVQDGGFDAPLGRVGRPRVFLQGDSEEALALSARAADVHLLHAAPIETLRSLAETLDRLSLVEGRTIELGLVLPIAARETADDVAALSDTPDGAIVGTYDVVAARLAELVSLGIGHLVLTAQPSLEEAYRVGQHVLPRLRALTQPALAA